MIWSLRHDVDTLELRLVARDYWDGQHERTEYRVLTAEGARARRFEGMDGRPVYSDLGRGFYITHENGGLARHEYLQIEDLPVIAEKVPCVRATNRRRKCPHCPKT